MHREMKHLLPSSLKVSITFESAGVAVISAK
jgi:hypothetical protein